MNTNQCIEKPVQIETAQWSSKSSLLPAIGRGLLPMSMIVAIGVVVVALVLLVRLLVDSERYFLLQQALFAIILIGGIACMIFAFIVTTRRTLKCIETWRERGEMTKVVVASVTLTLVGFVLACPILLTLLFGVGI